MTHVYESKSVTNRVTSEKKQTLDRTLQSVLMLSRKSLPVICAMLCTLNRWISPIYFCSLCITGISIQVKEKWRRIHSRVQERLIIARSTLGRLRLIVGWDIPDWSLISFLKWANSKKSKHRQDWTDSSCAGCKKNCTALKEDAVANRNQLLSYKNT